MAGDRTRLYSVLLFLGAGFLAFRALTLIAEGAHVINVGWVTALLYLELALAVSVMAATVPWFAGKTARAESLALRLAAGVTVLHSVRVLIFVLGRTGPWTDFDVRPEERAAHAARWSWGEVWFAGAMSVLSLVVLALIWRERRRMRRG